MSETVEAVLDASAILAVLYEERGAAAVEPFLGRAAISSVNLSEVACKLVEKAWPMPDVEAALEDLNLNWHAFDCGAAFQAAELRALLPRSLSFGDRACLALARHLAVPALTADTAWKDLRVPNLTVRVIR